MSIFTKMLQALGINTVDLWLEVPDTLRPQDDELQGRLTIIAKSDQDVKSVNVRLTEKDRFYDRDRDGKETLKSSACDLACFTISSPFQLSAGEIKVIPFTLVMGERWKSRRERATSTYEAIAWLLSETHGVRRTFEVNAELALQGTVIGPGASKHLDYVIKEGLAF